MSPSLESITRARYWTMVTIRILSAIVLIWSLVLVWGIVSRHVMYRVAGAGTGPPGSYQLWVLTVQMLVGPGPLAAGALACLRYTPALARWLIPLPRPGCAQCGYEAPPRAQQCPECGAPLAAS